MNPIVPIAVIAGAFFLFGKKGKAKKQAALPEPSSKNNGYGTLFTEDSLPNVISATRGEMFTVRLSSNPSTGYAWRLASTPPQNELEQVSKSGKPLAGEPSGSASFTEAVQGSGVGGGQDLQYFIFKAQKAGGGSIVFHLDPPGADLPPEQVVEIKVEITDN